MSETTLQKQTDEMGRVVVAARIENLQDAWRVQSGELPADDVRVIQVDDALVDTGCVSLGVPTSLIQELGLNRVRTRMMRTTNGPRECGVYDAVRLTVQNRVCTVEVYEIPDTCPVLIGQIPLEILDFVVDAQGRRLVGNPEHGGEWMIDMF